MTGTFTPKWVAPLAPKYPIKTKNYGISGYFFEEESFIDDFSSLKRKKLVFFT
jgi:hypothetical protein